ncbi:MAG: GTPase Era [Sphingomonadales bacterium]|jgi:GTP-binding protein Era|nr:GTPase Era [Sphingomonadales bacterium]MBK9003607.1 GTPase Era [Sphingomonadales bacterium]MBK9268780.1 GTPase Era [Sphingomonadales bacterium]
MTQRCGHVAVIGAPNAGKSTLVNALVGQKVAIVSPKAQTTRTRLMGIALEGDAQIILVDTPGIFAPNRRLDRAMVAAAWDGALDADLILMVVDGRAGAGPKVEKILEGLAGRPEKKWLILNKVDIAAKEKLLALTEKILGLCPFEQIYYVSAATSDGLAELKSAIGGAMPEGEWHFPEDQVSDASERLAAAEITREQLYLQLHDELPYASTVETEKYVERPDGSLEIYQQILVERETQRAIVLGKGGSRIKAIGAAARKEIGELMGVPVHLYLHVKVKAGWDEDRGGFRHSNDNRR